MRHFSVCFAGYSGVGKDECAGRLVQTTSAIHTGLADPAKRHMADLYGFTKEQLFGPSHFRNAGDPRYPKNIIRDIGYRNCGTGEEISKLENVYGVLRKDKKYVEVETRDLTGVDEVKSKPGWPEVPRQSMKMGRTRYFIEKDHPNFFLSPREALQLYCNLMNELHLDTWIHKGIEIHKQLAEVSQIEGKQIARKYVYDRMLGVVDTNGDSDPQRFLPVGSDFFTCFSDFRHRHEINLIRKAADTYTPVVIRVKSPRVPKPPYDHRSELEQETIPDSAFDFVINNDASLEELYAMVDRVVVTFTSPGWKSLNQDVFLGPVGE